MSLPRARPGEVNADFVDRYTLAHLASGALAGASGLGFVPTLIVAIAWEAVEPGIKEAHPTWLPGPATRDRKRNATGDVLAVIAGWWLARMFR